MEGGIPRTTTHSRLLEAGGPRGQNRGIKYLQLDIGIGYVSVDLGVSIKRRNAI